MEKALALAEIREHITKFLSRRELYCCVLVSKDWRESFEPWLHQKIKVSSYGRQSFSNPESIQRIARFIRNLEFRGMELKGFDCFSQCTLLQTLTVSDNHDCQSQMDQLTLFLLRNNASTLCEFRCFHSYDRRLLTSEITHAVADCSRLTTLEFQWVIISPLPEALMSVVLLFTRLRTLILNEVRFTCSLPVEGKTFPLLERLEIRYFNNLSFTQAIPIACHAPNLKVFLIGSSVAPPLEDLIDLVIPYCSQLEVLSVLVPRWPVKSRLRLVDAMLSRPSQKIGSGLSSPQLKWVDFLPGKDSRTQHDGILCYNYFYQMGVFAMLETIELKGCVWATSLYIQQILCTCVNLRAIQAEEIYALHVERSPPWVCHQLEFFKMRIPYATMRGGDLCSRGSGGDQAVTAIDVNLGGIPNTHAPPFSDCEGSTHAIFKRLAQLQKLCVLDTSYCWGYLDNQPTYRQGMCYRLDRGLGLLNSLKRLRHIAFMGLRPAPREEDIVFMLQAWPNLRFIHGEIHVDKEEDRDRVNQLSKRHGIDKDTACDGPFSYMYDQFY